VGGEGGQTLWLYILQGFGLSWAYMLPIEPVFEDICRTLSIPDPNSVRVFSTSEVTGISPQHVAWQSTTQRSLIPTPPLTKAGPSLSDEIELWSSPEIQPSSSKAPFQDSRSAGQEPRLNYDSIDFDDISYDSSQPTCLSPIERESNIRNPTLHFFGCLRESDRHSYFHSLPREFQTRIESELYRIENCRSLFGSQDETKHLIRRLRMNLNLWLRRAIEEHPVKSSKFGQNATSTDEKSFLATLDINSNVVYFKDSEPYTDRGGLFQGEFPNQIIPVNNILLPDSRSNPLLWECEPDMIRYFQIPANNMSWVEVRTSISSIRSTFQLLTMNSRKQYLSIIAQVGVFRRQSNDNMISEEP
jgi:hypothetical protein